MQKESSRLDQSGVFMFPLFIGYQTLENWLTAVDPTRPVFASLVTETGQPDRYNTRTDRLGALVAQGEADLVHYCRLPIAYLQYMGDQPFNEHKQGFDQANQVWSIVQDWLIDQGLVIKQGTVATPNNIRLLDGWADFLIFDSQNQIYCRKS